MVRRILTVYIAGVAVLYLLLPASISAKNLHLMESLPNGFAIYRSGDPSPKDMREFKRLGILEMAVLTGDAEKKELKFHHLHPDLRIVYNEKQNHRIPLDDVFLDWFDSWVETARSEGKIIAFRCHCGCHRAGRLAAYYQMRWQNLTFEDATVLMKEYGKNMGAYGHLWDQVRELEKRIPSRFPVQ